MNKRQFGMVATILGLGAVALSAACADQPKVKCSTGRGEFAARYTYVSGPESCKDRKAGVLGLQSYNLPGADKMPDLDKVPLAIQDITVLEQVSAVQAEDDTFQLKSTERAYALGIFTTGEPDDNGFCRVNMTKVAEVELPEATNPGASTIPVADREPSSFTTEKYPKRTVKYEWSDVVFYVTPSAAGTQFQATLKYTENTDVCEYKVFALYPSVSCSVIDPEANQNTETPRADAVCNADAPADLIIGNPVGSSINPDFARSCEEVQQVVIHGSQATRFLCLPKGDKLPALN